MRDLKSNPKFHVNSPATANSFSSGASQVDSENKKLLTFLGDDICSAILDTSFTRMVRKEKVLEKVICLGALELWSDDFEDKGHFGLYKLKLLDLIRCIAIHKPLLAGPRVAERINSIINNALISPSPAQDLAVMQSMSSALGDVVGVVFGGLDAQRSGSSEVQHGLSITFEGLVQQVLRLNWTEQAFVEVLSHFLIELGPFLKYYPNAVSGAINKLFELLTSLPSVVKDPSMNSVRRARLCICTSIIGIARAADKRVVPCLKAIADTMVHLKREDRVLRDEYNILGEAFLIMASSGSNSSRKF